MLNAYSQDSIVEKRNKSYDKKSTPSIAPSTNSYRSSERNLSNFRNVEDAITENNDEKKYQEYINIADRLSQEKKFEEANLYLNEALDYYSGKKNKKKKSQIHRKIALNNEKLKDRRRALEQYQKAHDYAEDKNTAEVLTNDMRRMQQNQSPTVKEKTLEQNISVFQNQNRVKDLTETYQQLAETALENQDTQKAIDALTRTQHIPIEKEDKIKAQEQLADIYASKDSMGLAASFVKEARQLALEMNDWVSYYNQTLKLSQFYVQGSHPDSAESILKESLDIAYRNKNTQGILVMTKELKDLYVQTARPDHAAVIVDSLLMKLWNIAVADTQIYQDAIFNEVQERIMLLEREKDAQTILIKKTKRYNIILTAISAGLILSTVLAVYSLFRLRKKNYLILLQSLRKEMNPHFIFNALNSVNLFIADNDELAANKYLTRYSSLMRSMMTASNKNFVPFDDELATLRDYILLEHMRFEDHFDYDIIVDEGLKEELFMIPNMILQPFIENAIWHGLRYKDGKGLLTIHFFLDIGRIKVEITDDGIGYRKSREIKSKNQKAYKSIGISNTLERIHILNRLFGCGISYQAGYNDIHQQTGHRVILSWNKNFSDHETE